MIALPLYTAALQVQGTRKEYAFLHYCLSTRYYVALKSTCHFKIERMLQRQARQQEIHTILEINPLRPRGGAANASCLWAILYSSNSRPSLS
jgi:hypothetical protein